MRPVAVSLVLAAALLAAAPALAAPRPAAAAVPPAIVEGTNGFALDLYGQLRQKPGNLCFSPASVSLALAMTAAGAQGDTAKEMAKVLRFRLAAPALHAGMGALVRELESAGGGAPELRIANRLFVQQGKPLQPEFAALTKEHYAAAAEVVSFVRAAEKARRAINGWVSDRTNGRIRDLIGAGVLTAATRLVLVNAIYFKADWQHQFEKHATYNEPFLVTPTQKRPVAMMHQTTSAGYAETRDTLVLELPYRGTAERDLALVIVLPRAADGLAKVEQGLDVARLAAYVKALRRERVDVALPRFKLDAA
ncbi:MAG TPA: serpin family protein, partial [Polyangia bacterium]